MAVGMMVQAQAGSRPSRILALGVKPVAERGPKLRDRNIDDSVGCKALISFGRLLFPTTWPACDHGENDEETQTQRW